MGKNIFLFLVLTSFASCDFAIKEKVTDNYYLIATDIGEDCSLGYHLPSDGDIYGTIIDATVFAVGFNDEYIIAKQHPRVFPNEPDKKITNYFILRITKDFDSKGRNTLFGPLN